MKLVLERQDFMNFLNENKTLKVKGLALESGVSYMTLEKIILYNHQITVKISDKLLPILRKYGWNENGKGNN